ncbi:UNVERIFIED_CONTAM: hypothetical protein GTU68_034470 [Idotea baltica]|nr:hypothetical protein [Idotea baltica]
MNFRDLEYICALSELRHFGRAAKSCHVSQPTLSAQIKKLEEQLGVVLFERSNKLVRATKIGVDIVAVAKEALQASDRIKELAEASRDPFAGQVSLGIIPTIAPYLISQFAKKQKTLFPDLTVNYSEDVTERLNEALLSMELDVAVLATPPETDAISAIPLYSESFWVLFPKGHPLTKQKELTISDLTQHEMLLLTEGHCLRNQALSVCQASQKQQNSSLKASSLETLVNLVAAGQGVTLVPEMAIRKSWISELGVVARKLEDETAERTVYLSYRRRYPHVEIIEALAEVISNGGSATRQRSQRRT